MESTKSVAGVAILRGTDYQPANLAGAVDWMRAKLADASLTTWQRGHLTEEIGKVERALAAVPPFVDVGTISEYGLTQKLSQAIRCF